MWRREGFTLVELMTSILLLGLLSIGIGSILSYTSNQGIKAQWELRKNSFLKRMQKQERFAIASVRSVVFNPSETFNHLEQRLTSSVPAYAPTEFYQWNTAQIPAREKTLPFYLSIKNIPSFKVELNSHLIKYIDTVTDPNGKLVASQTYLLISRCVPKTNAALTVLGNGKMAIDPSATWLSSIYVTKVLKRLPFYHVLSDDSKTAEIRCCEVTNPNCTDGEITNWLPRIYGIKLDNAGGTPESISENPFLGELDPVLGAGFMLTMDVAAMTYQLRTFTVENHCLLSALKDCQKAGENPLAALPSWVSRVNAAKIMSGPLQPSLSQGGYLNFGAKK